MNMVMDPAIEVMNDLDEYLDPFDLVAAHDSPDNDEEIEQEQQRILSGCQLDTGQDIIKINFQ